MIVIPFATQPGTIDCGWIWRYRSFSVLLEVDRLLARPDIDIGLNHATKDNEDHKQAILKEHVPSGYSARDSHPRPSIQDDIQRLISFELHYNVHDAVLYIEW
jgi:hypothetical protein